jgi:hypothetical protein
VEIHSVFKSSGEIGVVDLNQIWTIGSFREIGFHELGEQGSALVFKSPVCGLNLGHWIVGPMNRRSSVGMVQRFGHQGKGVNTFPKPRSVNRRFAGRDLDRQILACREPLIWVRKILGIRNRGNRGEDFPKVVKGESST